MSHNPVPDAGGVAAASPALHTPRSGASPSHGPSRTSRVRAQIEGVARRRPILPRPTPPPPIPAGPTVPEPEPPADRWVDLEATAYHADPCPTPSLSSHVAITVITRSLAHAFRQHPRLGRTEQPAMSAAADRGSAAHALLFGEDRLSVIEAEDYRTQAVRAARDTARSEGRIPLLGKELAPIEGMVKLARPRMADLHGGPFGVEQTALWRSDTLGWRRARLDTLSSDKRLIVDYKTTEGPVDAHACERRIAEMGLQIQAAAYVEAVEALQPELAGRVRFIFQWQEQKPPYALSPPIEMSEAYLSLGRAQWRAAGELWDAAIRQNAFPGYSPARFMACPPPWELSRWEEREQLIEARVRGDLARGDRA